MRLSLELVRWLRFGRWSKRVVYLAVGGAFEVVDTVVDAGLYRRGRFITSVARWLSLGFGLLSLAFVWDGPLTRRGAAVGIAAGSVRLPRGGSLPAAAQG